MAGCDPETQERVGAGGQLDEAVDASLRTQEGDVATDRDARFASVVSRNLDVALVVLSLAPALALGAPALGYLLGAGGWVLQRVVAVIDRRWTGKATDPVKLLAANLFEAFGRIWLLAGVIIIAAAIGERVDGLTAALVIFGAYTVAFVSRLLSGPPPPKAAE